MQATATRILVVAAGLVPARWLPAGSFAHHAPEISARLARSAPATTPLDVPDRGAAADARELAHDRFLAAALGLPLAPGVMSAVRALASRPPGDAPMQPPTSPAGDGWLLEPVRFLLARDHMVLDADRPTPVDAAIDRRLAELIRPLLADEGFALTVLGPGHWWLNARPDAAAAAGWQLDAVSRELAAGRHANDWLPGGADSRRFRRLLNEVQMTWHAADDADGAIQATGYNGIWPTGPIPLAAIHRWQSLQDNGQLQFDDSLLKARVAGEPDRWLEGWAQAVPRWLERSAGAGPGEQAILLCGEQTASWLMLDPRRDGSASAAPGSTGGPARIEGLLRQAARAGRTWMQRALRRSSASSSAAPGKGSADGYLERLFSGD